MVKLPPRNIIKKIVIKAEKKAKKRKSLKAKAKAFSDESKRLEKAYWKGDFC